MPEHTFPSKDQVTAFEADMAKRTAAAKGIADYHYSEFLKRIQTREAFTDEIKGKLLAIKESGYPLPIDEKNIDELIALLALDVVGDPQVWPPNG